MYVPDWIWLNPSLSSWSTLIFPQTWDFPWVCIEYPSRSLLGNWKIRFPHNPPGAKKKKIERNENISQTAIEQHRKWRSSLRGRTLEREWEKRKSLRSGEREREREREIGESKLGIKALTGTNLLLRAQDRFYVRTSNQISLGIVAWENLNIGDNCS